MFDLERGATSGGLSTFLDRFEAMQRRAAARLYMDGSARALAEQLRQSKAAKILQKTLDEESAADEKLTALAESEILPAALSGEEEEK